MNNKKLMYILIFNERIKFIKKKLLFYIKRNINCVPIHLNQIINI